MPDMERLTRSLKLHLTPTPEATAFVRGKYSGLDEARKQVSVKGCCPKCRSRTFTGFRILLWADVKSSNRQFHPVMWVGQFRGWQSWSQSGHRTWVPALQRSSRSTSYPSRHARTAAFASPSPVPEVSPVFARHRRIISWLAAPQNCNHGHSGKRGEWNGLERMGQFSRDGSFPVQIRGQRFLLGFHVPYLHVPLFQVIRGTQQREGT